MTKATETAAFLAIIFTAWAAMYIGVVPLPEKFRNEIVPVLPWWLLVAFGAYALGSLGIDVLTFKDKPEKYAELMDQVEEAKADLKKQGIEVD